MGDCNIEHFNYETKTMYEYGKQKLETNGYTVGECIGEGAFGKAFMLEKDGKKYVMKMIFDQYHPHLDKYNALEMEINIYEEFRKYCDQGQDNVLCLYDRFVGHFEDRYGIALESTLHTRQGDYMEGRAKDGLSPKSVWNENIHHEYMFIVFNAFENMSLTKYLRDENPTKVDKENIIHSLCRNMKFLHDKGVTHKDIKPDNIIINSHTKQCYMIDYGLSCLFTDPQYDTCKYQMSGSLLYMSPEITGRLEIKKVYDDIEHELFAKVIDLWALGCVFYEVLNGKHIMREMMDYMKNLVPVEINGTPIATYETQIGLEIIKNCLLVEVLEPQNRKRLGTKLLKSLLITTLLPFE